jgi:antirestriction protein
MPKQVNTTEFTIGSHFLPALINGDDSGLNDKETVDLDIFDRFIRANQGQGHWSVPDDAEPEFAICEIDDIMSDCLTIEYVTITESYAMITLHAQPYDFNASGFYFHNFDEWEEKFERKEANGCEEFEIQYIDGDDEKTAFASIHEPTQANIEEWFDLLDEWEVKNEMEQAAIAYLVEDLNVNINEAFEQVEGNGEEPALMEGSVLDYAYEIVDECGMLDDMPDNLRHYFDYESFARDLEISGDVATFDFRGTHYVVTNACCL